MKRKIIFISIITSILSLIGCKTTEVKDDKNIQQVANEPEKKVNDEYLRSLENVSSDEISVEEFEYDKAEILRIISELSKIMETGDVNAWLTYISPDSIRYYSSPQNVKKAQQKLPDKTIRLKGIGDYFKYVFIPSRKRSQVDEIRYISKDNIKAVQVKPDGSIIIYYYFVKVNGKWLVHIPTL